MGRKVELIARVVDATTHRPLFVAPYAWAARGGYPGLGGYSGVLRSLFDRKGHVADTNADRQNDAQEQQE
jgi:hypothetical protein